MGCITSKRPQPPTAPAAAKAARQAERDEQERVDRLLCERGRRIRAAERQHLRKVREEDEKWRRERRRQTGLPEPPPDSSDQVDPTDINVVRLTLPRIPRRQGDPPGLAEMLQMWARIAYRKMSYRDINKFRLGGRRQEFDEDEYTRPYSSGNASCEHDDLFQEMCLIGLRCTQLWDSAKGSQFKTYLFAALQKRVTSMSRASWSKEPVQSLIVQDETGEDLLNWDAIQPLSHAPPVEIRRALDELEATIGCGDVAPDRLDRATHERLRRMFRKILPKDEMEALDWFYQPQADLTDRQRKRGRLAYRRALGQLEAKTRSGDIDPAPIDRAAKARLARLVAKIVSPEEMEALDWFYSRQSDLREPQRKRGRAAYRAVLERLRDQKLPEIKPSARRDPQPTRA